MKHPVLIKTRGQHTALIYDLNSADEYRVVFYENGVRLPKADYFTPDEDDARGTAEAELLRIEERNPVQ